MKESSMLQELYYGNVSPYERRRVHTREYEILTGEINRIKEYFKNLLSPEEYEQLKKMQDIQSELDAMDDRETFEYAFRTGALLMIDVFDCDEND